MNGDDSSAKKPGDEEQISESKRKAFDDIAQYFSKNEWEKLQYSQKITYVYMKRNYEAMSRLGFQVTVPLFMRNKQAKDIQEDDSDRDSNPGNLVKRHTLTLSMFQGLFSQHPKGQNMPGAIDCVRERIWPMKRSATLRKMTNNSPQGYDTCP
uniref:KRAB-related domain-containing protein n=1 Tax=Saimiri boliviensis boliviensis TaxID=39432 RepID=A0A2K6UGH7_SAIBB